MGEILEISCGGCGYREEFRLGRGLLYEEIPDVLVAMEIPGKAMQEEIFTLREKSGIRQTARRSLAVCRRCGRIVSRFVLEIRWGKRVYRTRHRCTHCNKYLEYLEPQEALGLPCPRCGGSLHSRSTGSWD